MGIILKKRRVLKMRKFLNFNEKVCLNIPISIER